MLPIFGTEKRVVESYDVEMIRKVNMLKKLGKIPNMYSRFFKVDYNPNNYPLFSEIFDRNSFVLNQ